MSAYVLAENKRDVEATFDAKVVEDLPAWLAGDAVGVPSIDIDEPSSKVLPRRGH